MSKTDNLESNKKVATIMYKGILVRWTVGYLSGTMEARKQWTYLNCWKKKSINQEFCIWQNCLSKVREKLRYSQTNKSWGSSLQVDLPWKKCYKVSSSWNERTLNGNLQLYEEIKIYSKGNYMGKYKSKYYCVV